MYNYDNNLKQQLDSFCNCMAQTFTNSYVKRLNQFVIEKAPKFFQYKARDLLRLFGKASPQIITIWDSAKKT